MKKIFSFVFAAMMLLVSSSAMAQSETLKGDVNADGVVDVADIAAIIKIMQEAGGAVEETKYYWYAGWTIPTAENIATIINEKYPVSSSDNTLNIAGGVSTTNSGYSPDKPFASITTNRNNVTDANRENSGMKTNYYVVVPNNMGIYSTNSPTTSVLTTFTKHSEFNNHIVYKSQETSRNINALMIY